MDGVIKGLRPYLPDDLPRLTTLLREARAWPPPSPPTPQDVLLRWQRRNVAPEYDVSVLPGPNGELAAYSQVTRFDRGEPRLGFEIAVLPPYRNLGVGGALYRLVEARARSNGIMQITSPVYLAPGEVRPDSEGFLLRRGFHLDSGYWQMRIDEIGALAGPHWPDGIGCRLLGPSRLDLERWAELIRECFNEPASAEGVSAQLDEAGVSREGYFFAVDTRTGLEVGTSRSRIDYIGGRQVGYIGTVGVLPAYRGRGIAEALIRQTLAYLASRDMSSATLFVENANTAARKLYSKMGWTPVYRTDHYWKRFTQPLA